MKKIFLLSLMLLFLTAEAAAATKLEGLKVFTDSKGEMLEFKFNFTSAFDGKVVTNFYEKSVQVDLIGVTIEPSNRTFSVSDEYIKSVRALQYQKDVVRIRFNLLKNDIDIKDAFKHISTGSEITFFFNKSKISLPEKVGSDSVAQKKKPITRPDVQSEKDGEFEAKFANIASMMSGEAESGVAYAAETSPEAVQNLSVMPDIYTSAMKMIFYLLAILGVIYFALKILKKKGVVGGNKSLFGKEKAIKVIERTFIDNKKSLAIAEICGEYMILGVGENNINLIGKLEGEQKAKYLADKEGTSEAAPSLPVQPLQSKRSTQPTQPTQPMQTAPAKKGAIKSSIAKLLKGKKSEEAFMELLAQKFTAYDEPKAPVQKKKIAEKAKAKVSMIDEINNEKEEAKAQKMLEMLRTKAVAMQDVTVEAPKAPKQTAVKAPAPKKQKPEPDMITQDYFARKNKLKFV